MKTSRLWLQKYFDKELPAADKLAELFTFRAFEVEGLEKTGSDDIIDLKVLPDRAHYALCHRGMAREVSAITGMSMLTLETPAISGTAPEVCVTVQDFALCRRYVGRIIENVTVGESPLWLKEKLEAVGSRSINAIVDATNYVMFDIGQPLHAFDADKVKGGIFARLAKEGEKITTLDGKEIDLLPSELVIADDVGPLAIAGVKGGKRAEVDANTTRIIIESANFDPVSVRRTSTRVKIKNDSSKRFENELTPHLAGEGVAVVSALIGKLCPNAKFGPVVDVHGTLSVERTIAVTPSAISERLGVEVSKDEIVSILSKLGISSVEAGDTLSLSIPHDRLDLIIPEDIVEEVGRLVGYEKIPAVVPAVSEALETNPVFYWSERVKNVLQNLGFSEVSTYALVAKGHFEVAYPLASDKKSLREGLTEGMTKSLALNATNADLLGLSSIKVFEIGNVFTKDSEKLMLAMGSLVAKKQKGVKAEDAILTAVAALEADLGVSLGIKPSAAGAGMVAEIDLGALVAQLPVPKSYADLSFGKAAKVTYKPYSAYPYIVRDIALFVPAGTEPVSVAEVLKTAVSKSAGALLVKGPEQFDRFEKDGKLSLAYRMIFQAFDRTLSDDEANGFMTGAYEAAKGKGWEVR